MHIRLITLLLAAVAIFATGLVSPSALFGQFQFENNSESAWLAQNGVFNGKIWLPEKPSPEERDAAQLLATWFEIVAEVKPEIATEAAGDALTPGIYVGATRRAMSRKIAAPVVAHGESWHWKPVRGRTLFLLGNSPLATRLAAADFVQRHLGVLFLMPGEWGTEWAPRKNIALPREALVFKPAVAWRALGGLGDSPAQQAWRLNNGLGAMPKFAHGLHTVFDAEAARKHPEFFPLISGVRQLPDGLGEQEPQPNLSAPGAAAYAAGRIANFFHNEPDAVLFPLGINGNMTWDEEAASRALASPGTYFRGRPDFSNYVFVFMNRVATALWNSPDDAPQWNAIRWRDTAGTKPAAAALVPPPPSCLLGCVAGGDCERPPDFSLHPNILPVIATDRSQWRDPDFREHDSALVRQWARSGVRHFGLYDFYHGSGFIVPRFFYDEQIDSIRWGAAHDAAIFYAEVHPDWGFDGAKTWLATRLLLRPSQNSALLLRQYFDEAYGPASSHLREFHNIVENCWKERAGAPRHLKFWRMENAGELIKPDEQQHLRDTLRRAETSFQTAIAHVDSLTLFPPGDPALTAAAAARASVVQKARARLTRQQMRVRMTTLAFDATDAFLDWYRLRAELLSRAAPTKAEQAREIWRQLKTEPALRKKFHAALQRWNTAGINPGEPRQWADFLSGGIGATVTERLIRACADALAKNPADAQWTAFYHELAADARTSGMTPLLIAASRPQAMHWLLRETFPRSIFTSPPFGSRLAARPVTLPCAPWMAEVADSAALEFGFTAEENNGRFPNNGVLRMKGVSDAFVARDFDDIAPGSHLVAKVQIRGRVNPATFAALQLRFFDAADNLLPEYHSSVIHPADIPEWRPVACIGRVPANAATVRLALVCKGQEVGETLDWDNLSMGKIVEEKSPPAAPAQHR